MRPSTSASQGVRKRQGLEGERLYRKGRDQIVKCPPVAERRCQFGGVTGIVDHDDRRIQGGFDGAHFVGNGLDLAVVPVCIADNEEFRPDLAKAIDYPLLAKVRRTGRPDGSYREDDA